MSLILVTSVAVVTNTAGTATALTTGAFTPIASSLLVPLWAGNTIDPNNPASPSIAGSLSPDIAWLLSDWQSHADSPNANGQAAIWQGQARLSASQTVTVNNNALSPNRHAALGVQVLIGFDPAAPIGAHNKAGSKSATAATVTHTPTRDGSLGFLAVADWSATGSMTANANMTLIATGTINVSDLSWGFAVSKIPGTRGTPVTLALNLAGTSTDLSWVFMEVLPDLTPPRGVRRHRPSSLWVPGRPRHLPIKYAETVAGTPSAAETGGMLFVVTAAGIAVKVAPQTGATAVPVRTTGTAAKKAPESGATALAVVAGGADAKRAVQAGTSMLAVRTSGVESTADTRAQTGSSVLLIRTTGAEMKRATPLGAAVIAVRTTAAASKRAAQTGATLLAVTAAGAQIHRQVQTGATEITLRPTGAATNRIAKQAGTTEIAIAPAGAASSKKVAAAGTTSIAISAAGFEATGSSRSQTGACTLGARTTGAARKTAILTGAAMVAATGNGSAVKKAPESGGVSIALRTTALEVKRAASAGKSYVGLLGTGTGGKRVNAAGRTVVSLLGFGSQAPPFVPPVRLGDRLEDILNALISFTARLGIFGKVQGHEPKAAPRNGLTAALWLQAMAPALGESGLGSTSLRVSWFLRIYQNFLSEPQDLIDPSVMKACADVMEALTGNFDLDIPQVRAIDLLGMTGPPMAAEAGYIQMEDRRIYRCMTLTIPIIVDDAFVQTA